MSKMPEKNMESGSRIRHALLDFWMSRRPATKSTYGRLSDLSRGPWRLDYGLRSLFLRALYRFMGDGAGDGG